MDPKQQNTKPGVAPTEKPAPALVKCEVRPFNRYGGKIAGEIVEVEPREYQRCRNALISIDDKAREAEAAAEAAATPNEGQALFHSMRKSAREAARVGQENRIRRRAEELRAMGVQVQTAPAKG